MPTSGQGGRIFVFGFLTAIAPLSIDIYLPALPMLRQALAADEAHTLFTLSAFFIGFGLGQLLLGPLSDRFGRKRPLIAGLAVYIVASIACALATSISDVVLWRFVQAFGGSVVPTVVQAMVRDLYDRNQSARILSLNMLVIASAPIVAPLIGGQVLLWFDWRAIFWVLVGFGLVSLVAAFALKDILIVTLHSDAPPSRRENHQGRPKAGNVKLVSHVGRAAFKGLNGEVPTRLKGTCELAEVSGFR